MDHKTAVSRRKFMGGLAAAVGYAGLCPPLELSAAQRAAGGRQGRPQMDYDAMAKLSSNENPYGPSPAVMKAMEGAWKYANRYGYPDGGIVQAIADFHGVKPENVLLGAGSGEILKVMDDAFLTEHKLVVGVDPTYESVYKFMTNSKADAIKIPLRKDYSQDIPAMIRATKNNYRDVGFVYLCNPNNPTGNIIPKQDIKMLLDGIPGDIPVLIDEAYHHFVDDPNYAESIPYVKEGRNVVVARTFSKIAALAGMRLGYAIAPKEMIDRMRPVSNGSINALVKHAGVVALKDKDYEAKTQRLNSELRAKTMGELKALGYEVIPSQTNFFMVNVKRDVVELGEEFKKKGVLVGRKFPPMNEWMRVSIGTADEMNRFMTAFKEILPASTSSAAKGA
jgi:histidinol-phosphate aminotransferase